LSARQRCTAEFTIRDDVDDDDDDDDDDDVVNRTFFRAFLAAVL